MNSHEGPSNWDLSLRLPAYEIGVQELIDDAQSHLMRAQHELLREVRIMKRQAVPTTVVSAGHQRVEREPEAGTVELTMSHEEIRRNDFSEFFASLSDAAYERGGEFISSMLAHISEVCDLTGQSVDNRGRALDPDSVLDAIAATRHSFDSEGNLKPGHSIVASPETAAKLRAMNWTESHRARYDEIIEKQREAWLARKRDRRIR